MRLLVAAGQPAAALNHYRETERRFREELGAPSPLLRRLAADIERQQNAPSEPASSGATPAASAAPQKSATPTPALAPASLSGTVTFVMADIPTTEADLSRTEESRQEERREILRLLRRVLRDHEGQLVRVGADSILFAFGRPLKALEAVTTAVSALEEERQAGGLSRIRLAMHTGETPPDFPQNSGEAADYAALMLRAAHRGQMLCSDVTASLLASGRAVSLRNLGVYRFRESGSPEAVFQLLLPDKPPTDFPPLRALFGYSGYLPPLLTRFFGREKEMEELLALLHPAEPEARSPRLITLTGPGGTGKTRLATEAARLVLPRFQGAVWFISLADAARAEHIAESIARALQLPRTEHITPLEQVIELLSSFPTLLILDNFEQIVEPGAPVVRELVERLPRLTCLVTSRYTLELTGEREIALSPLPIPDESDTAIDFEQITGFDCVQMFVDRAQTARPTFQITPGNAPAIAALCARLEGIPLAIELAASRAQVLTPAQMLSQISRRFDFLVSRKRDVAQRHQTLRGAIDWSYRLLSPELQQFFARLSIFRGGWSLEAAEAVCEEPMALDYLGQLRQCSLVLTVETGEETPEVRFRLLESLREYADEQLSIPERQERAQLHALFFAQMTEEAEPHYYASEQPFWVSRLEREMDNLRAALAFGLQEQPEIAARIAGSLWWFWGDHGHLVEGREWLGKALALYTTLDRIRALALNAAAGLALMQNDLTYAESWLAESLPLWEQFGESDGLARCLLMQGKLYALRSEVDQARAQFIRCLQLWERAGNLSGVFHALLWLGTLSLAQCDYIRSLELFEESLKVARQVGSLQGAACAIGSIGMLALETGDDVTARERYEEVLPMFRSLEAHWDIGNVLRGLGCVALRQRDDARAETLFAQAAQQYLKLGMRNEIGNNAFWRIQMRVPQEQYAEAFRDTQEGLTVWRELKNPWWIAALQLIAGHLAWAMNEGETARGYVRDALRDFRKIENTDGVLASVEAAAALEFSQGQPETAAQMLTLAETLRQEMQAPVGSWWRHQQAHISKVVRAAPSKSLSEEITPTLEEAARRAEKSVL
jgi:predicted ATPase/class 3 adenylate cyclase